MIDPNEALERLCEGNRRFVEGATSARRHRSEARRRETAERQEPFAVVLGCSDSRVPVEIVFDQGVGDLFVIRVAGHVAAPSQIASVEFAAERFGTRLVVVLGHERCGAVLAAIEARKRPQRERPAHLDSIVERIRPALEALPAEAPKGKVDERLRRAIRANVGVAVDTLRHGSAILERLASDDGLRVVGAVYSLESGAVEFLDTAE